MRHSLPEKGIKDPLWDNMIGCGLGGPARQIAAHYGCHVIGIDLTHAYIEAGNVLSGWLHLKDRVVAAGQCFGAALR